MFRTLQERTRGTNSGIQYFERRRTANDLGRNSEKREKIKLRVSIRSGSLVSKWNHKNEPGHALFNCIILPNHTCILR